ncbi:putative oleosin [Medicago truncatula]|uniref:Oleosin n=1 Tax=Medicago truncatula TaxID=3880 RepID=A0A072TY85_MEDTR|nr:oleosin Ara h 10.0102 [Medicago truncatula]KEH22161.1 oleosin [Medicago truncatula]RHN45175.1 putative oleosin [Medicago truncatula]
MATDRTTPHQIQVHTTTRRYDTITPPLHYEGGGGVATHHYSDNKSPSTSQVLAVITGLPVGGILLALAGLSLLGTLTGLAVTTPLFILFSPVIVPATIVIGLAVAGFLTSGAFGLTALSSFSWVMNYIRQTQGTVPEQLESAKQGMADVVGYVGQKTKEAGQKTKEVGQDIQSKAQDAKKTSTTTTATTAA